MRRRSAVASLIVVALVAGASGAVAGPRIPPRLLGGHRTGRVGVPHVGIRAAFSFKRKDPNDAKGPLDLSWIRLVRGKSKDLLVWGTIGPVSNTDIDPDNGNFAIGFDTNDNQKLDYMQYVYYGGGRVRGVLVNLRTNRPVTRAIPTARVNARTFKQNLLPAKIASPGTYRFVVFSYYQSSPCSKKHYCVDSVPNRYPLFAVDHRAPSVTWGTTYQYSSDARDDLKSPVSFSFADDTYGTGVKSWTVQRRAVGTTGWTDVATGQLLSPTVLVPGVEGASYDVRILVTDRQRNQVVSSLRRTTFPYDDQNAVFDYTGSPGVWTSAPDANAFLGSTASGAQTATVTISWTGGSNYCLLGGPTTGTGQATATLDTVTVGPPSDETSGTAPMAQVLCGALGGGSGAAHMLILTVSSTDPYVLDGIVVAP